MAVIRIPYSKTHWELTVPDENLVGVLESRVNDYSPDGTQEEIVDRALTRPIGSPGLEELVQGKKSVVIVTSDHTRPVPGKITMPMLVQRLRAAESGIEIKILIATGYHRAPTDNELLEKFGEAIVGREKIIIHDSRDSDSLVNIGVLPSGGELWLNRVAIETDFLMAEGFIEPHFFAGFSGGRKSILPGIAGYRTVLANHCSEFIASDDARTGIMAHNPIDRDMQYAARTAKLAFILNVVLNDRKEIINCFAGDRERAHLEGCDFLAKLAKVRPVAADIVVTSNGGYPLDQNIYQAVKGMTAAEATCKPGGIIIMVSACNDGHGGQSFYDHMASAPSPTRILEHVLKIPRNETVPDQWEFQILARILSQYQVILVTNLCDPKIVTAMHMEHAFTMEDALNRAFNRKGQNAKVAVIPDGVAVIVASR